MDNFAEQLVTKDTDGSARAKSMALFVGGALLTLLLAGLALVVLFNGSPLGFLFGAALACASGFGTWRLFQNMQVEYEYTFTNGSLDIDKILAKTRRKELLTLEVRKVTDFGVYDSSVSEPSDMTIVEAAGTPRVIDEENGEAKKPVSYYADFPHEEYGNTRLIFTPDEKMLGMITRALPGALRNKIK